MKIGKFIVPAATLLVGAALGVVYGVKNADGIKDAFKAGKEAAKEKLEQLKEAAEEVEAKAKEAAEDGKKEAEEVAGKVAEAAAEIVDIGEKQPQQPREQPRGKDGKFIKS